MIKRGFMIGMMVLVFCSMFTGCFDQREVDDMAYVIAVGFDKGKTNALKMTLQFAVPVAMGGGEGGGEPSKALSITTVETPTIYSGLNMVNNYVSKQVNLSHAKVVVFSEELAREGIYKYIHALIRNREFRGSMHLAVARGDAEEYIRSNVPKLEINPAKYYSFIFNAYRYTGFTADTQLLNFYFDQEGTYRQGVAVLASVSKYQSSEDFQLEGSTYKEKGRKAPMEGDFKAGDLPKTYDVDSEVMGLAVFDGGKMVGEMDGQETLYYLMISGEYDHSYISFPDPISEDNYVILNVKQSRKPVHQVTMDGDNPKISAKIRLEADIISIQSGINYESMDHITTLEESIEAFVKKEIVRYLERTSKEFHVDICGFGKVMKMKFLTWDEWKEFNWLPKYKNSSFDVEVDLKIRRPGLMIRSMPATGSEGEVMD